MHNFKSTSLLISSLGFITLMGCFNPLLNLPSHAVSLLTPRQKQKRLNGDLLYFDKDKSQLFRYSFRSGGKTQITRIPAQYLSPQWSPNKKQIAFASDVQNSKNQAPEQRTSEIAIANNDGTEWRQVTRNQGYAFSPVFLSKNRLLYTNITKDKDQIPLSSICAIDIDGTNFHCLAQGSQEQNPSPSPDGRKIVFVAQTKESQEIFIMNSDGSNRKRLTSNSWPDQTPAWSPDGRKIAFVSRQDDNYDICLMNADGSGLRHLTQAKTMETLPCFSPDGRHIAFCVGGNNSEIQVMDLDSGNVRRLELDGNNVYPSWR